MIYEFNDKKIKIPDNEIENDMKILGISREEAIQMFLEDEGYLENETVEELTKKAKENKTVQHDAKSNKPRKNTTKERKPDIEKEGLINLLAETLKDAGYLTEITNKSKIIEFKVDENHYKLDLIKQRNPKK